MAELSIGHPSPSPIRSIFTHTPGRQRMPPSTPWVMHPNALATLSSCNSWVMLLEESAVPADDKQNLGSENWGLPVAATQLPWTKPCHRSVTPFWCKDHWYFKAFQQSQKNTLKIWIYHAYPGPSSLKWGVPPQLRWHSATSEPQKWQVRLPRGAPWICSWYKYWITGI